MKENFIKATGRIEDGKVVQVSSELVADYVVTVSNSECEGAVVYTFRGTADQAKAVVRGLLFEDAKNDERFLEYSFDDLSASLQYSDYHICYEARKVSEIPEVKVNERCLKQAELCGDSDYGRKKDLDQMLRVIQEIEDEEN